MKPSLAFIALLLVAATAGSPDATRVRAAEKPRDPAPRPTVIVVPDHDLSPNLRDITPFRPAEPEPLRQFHEEVEREEERVRQELIEAEARRGVVKDRAWQGAAGRRTPTARWAPPSTSSP
jgi:hypothetical protein